MLKKKYFMLLLLLLFVLLLGIFSSCYAYDFTPIETQIELTKQNIDNGDNPPFINYTFFNYIYNWVNSNFWATIKTQINTNMTNNDTVVLSSDSSAWFHVFFKRYNTSDTISINNDGKISGTAYWVHYRFHNNNGTLEGGLQASEKIGGNYTPQYYYQNYFCNFMVENYDYNKQMGDYLYTWNEPTAYINDTQIIGESILVNDNQFYTQFRIGYFWNINDTQLKITYFDNSNNKITIENPTITFQNDETGQNGYIAIINYNEDIPLNTPLYYELYYKNKYVSTSDWTMIALNNNNNNNTNITTNGEITNTSGDKTGNIDLSGVTERIDITNKLIQEQTQAIISGDKELRDAIISGDKQILGALTNTNFSGDITMEDLPQVEIDDPSEEFFSWLLTNIEDVILYNGDSTLVIPIYNTQHEIRSDVFKLETEPLKSFISIGWWFVCGIPLLKWVRHTIETIRSGNIPQVDDKSDLLGNVL